MVIEINGVNKKIGSKQVIQDVSLSIGRGQVFALLGPNGAGKTTLIRIILGLLKAETGTIRLFGQELTAQSRSDLLLRIGVQNDGNLYENLTIEDNLALWGQIYGLDQATIQKRLAELKQKFHLEAYSNMPVGSLSKGNRQKVMLARAMFHNPEVLILDEPTSGLDPVSRDEMNEIFRKLAEKGVAILFSTHITSDLEKCADTITYIKNGELLLSTNKEDFIRHFTGEIGGAPTLEDIMVHIEREEVNL